MAGAAGGGRGLLKAAWAALLTMNLKNAMNTVNTVFCRCAAGNWRGKSLQHKNLRAKRSKK